MTYKSVRAYAESLQLQEGTSKRVDCPTCGARNTFSVTKTYGKLLWQCFRNSCMSRGSSSSMLTERGLHALLGIYQEVDLPFELPSYFVPIGDRPKALAYLQDNHCMDAYTNRRAEILYDPRLDRVVFTVKRDGEYYDASGRSMDRGVVPKWYRYGKSDMGFLCRNDGELGTRQCCVVEDAASACAVSVCMDGMALLGTNLLQSHVLELIKYDEVLIALDPDALDKSFKIQSELQSYVQCRTIITPDDPKYFGREEMQNILG